MAESKNTRDDIIRSTLNCAFYRSVGDTSLANVAEGINIKKASIYNHFNNRDDLLKNTEISCKEYIDSISFIPNDLDSVARKYPAETVLKGIVDRYFKMHEKAPLLQIYTFLQSQKYFSDQACEIVTAQKNKLIAQTEKVLTALLQNEKINIDASEIHSTAMWFCSGMNDMLNDYLLERKMTVLHVPSKDCELVSTATDEAFIEKVNAYIEKFSELLK